MFISKNPNLYNQICSIEAFDCHTHIDTTHPVARGIHDVLLYHMVISDLYSVGCPDGARMSEQPDTVEIEQRVTCAIPYLPYIENTSSFFALRMILLELFDWDEPVTLDNWRKLDERIKAYSAVPNRLKEIMQKSHVRKYNTELWRCGDGSLDHCFNYSMEWAFFTRAQWGRYDTALIELEYAWNHAEPCSPLPVTLTADMIDFQRKIRTSDHVMQSIEHFLDKTPFDRIIAIASHFSTDVTYRAVSDQEMKEALARRDTAGPEEQNIYASYIIERYLSTYEGRGLTKVLQFSTGAEPLLFESGSKMRAETPFELANIFYRYPGIQFNIHLSNMAQNQTFCTLAREIPNLTLNGYWWHNFYPSFIPRILSERIDMLPVGKTVGLFSDAYCAEWAYAKQKYIRYFTTQVLSERMEMGQYTEQQVLSIANNLFRGTACRIFGVEL